ncbi:MAG: PilZ domain-containing protein [Xanthobacteraceae bacterium]
MRPEFRKKKRRYISHGARIALADGSLLENCRIIDISGTGARLEIKNLEGVPDQFVLLLSYDGRLRRQCSVVWRSETAIGIEFAPDCPTS